MKKITGKALSLVLSLALVASSFSASFAFASTKSVTGVVSDTDKDSIYLVNGSSDKDYEDLRDNWIKPELETKDHQAVDGVEIAAISHSSGDSLVKWDIDDDGEAALTVKKTDAEGKEVLSVLYEGTWTNDDGDDVTVKARKDFTVYVLDEGSYVIGKTYATPADRNGKSIEAPDTFAQTAGSEVEVNVYKVGKVSGSAEAAYTKATVTSKETGITTVSPTTPAAVSISLSSEDNVYFDSATATALEAAQGTAATLVLVSGKNKGTPPSGAAVAKDASVSNLTITAKTVKDGKASDDSDDKYTLKTKVEKKIDVAWEVTDYNLEHSTATVSTTDFTIDTDHGTQLYGANVKLATVTDSEVVFPDGTTSVTVDDGSVKKISGRIAPATDPTSLTDIKTLTINDDASVGEVDLDYGNVDVDGGKVGDITTVGDVNVTSGKAGNIDNTSDDSDPDGSVTINGGSVGTIASDSDVTIDTTDEDTTASTGKVSAANVTIYSDEAKVSVDGVKVTGDDGNVTVKGEDVTFGTVDLDHRNDAALQLGDEDDEAFTGTIAAPANAENGRIETENEDTVATVTGTVNVDTISVGSDTTLTFTGDVTVDSVDGDGTLKIAAGKLYVTGGVSGATLALTDSSLTSGMTVFKADSDAVDADDFDTFGFTLTKSEGSSVDTFKIDTLEFAGLQINKSSSKIAVGYSETFTASAYPGGTSLPADATVVWEFDGSDDVFEVTPSGNTATVKVLALDPDFTSENHGTLTAKLQDADGYDLDDYASASIDLSAIAVPEIVSDTTSNFSIAPGASYTFKITSATQPVVTAGTAGVFTVTDVGKSGNDYFVKITAIGKVGAEAGIYVNGAKLLVASIKSGITSDTTSDITVKKGASYTYKITAPSAPTFAVGTANVLTYKLTSQSGNNYFYQITAVGAAGAKAGVYVNGQKINAVTIG